MNPMKMGQTAILVLFAAGVGYLLGRGSKPRSAFDSTANGAVLARFAGHALYTGDVGVRLRAMPDMARARLAPPEARRQLVEEIVREQILARRAEEKGYQHDPEFARRYAEELGTFCLEKEFEEPERRRALTDDDLRKYFDEHKAELSRPDRVRIAIIAFKVPRPEEREKKRALAGATLAEARARSKDYYAFGKLARARSEDERTRASSGEVGYASRGDLEGGYGPELAKAAFELSGTGEVRNTVVESAGALYLVKLVGRDAAYEPKFEMVRDALKSRLANERRNADRKRFLDELWKQAEVKIDDDAVRALAVEEAPARRP